MVATIKDVAKKANVSISTVSRVLSNQMHVSSSTYKRIQDAVAELNYIPNSTDCKEYSSNIQRNSRS